jgi:hypothetical protein
MEVAIITTALPRVRVSQYNVLLQKRVVLLIRSFQCLRCAKPLRRPQRSARLHGTGELADARRLPIRAADGPLCAVQPTVTLGRDPGH